MKKPALVFFILFLILLGSIISNAQGEAKVEVQKSWLSKFIDFLKSLFSPQKTQPIQVNQSAIQEKKENISKVVTPSANLSKKYLEWFNRSKGWLHPENPAVKCISEKTCNGSYEISFKVNYSLSAALVNNTFGRYGNVTKIEPHPNDGEYRVTLVLKNIEILNDFIDIPYLYGIYHLGISSDYGYDISEEELASCKKDDDCTRVTSGCCGCGSGGGAKAINKEYSQFVEDKRIIGCMETGCVAVMSGDFTCLSTTAVKCINRSCTFLSADEAPCDTPLYKICREDIPKSLWGETSYHSPRYEYPVETNSFSCGQIIGLCEENMSKKEVYERCLNKTSLAENYTLGQVIVTFDPNFTEDEIYSFINNSGFKIDPFRRDYYYEIRDGDSPDPNIPLGEEGVKKRAYEMLEKPAKDFEEYLRSFPIYVRDVLVDTNLANSLIVVWIHGKIPLDVSEQFIKSYSKFGDFQSLVVRGNTLFGSVLVPEGTEAEALCKLRDEKIITKAYYNLTT